MTRVVESMYEGDGHYVSFLKSPWRHTHLLSTRAAARKKLKYLYVGGNIWICQILSAQSLCIDRWYISPPSIDIFSNKEIF